VQPISPPTHPYDLLTTRRISLFQVLLVSGASATPTVHEWSYELPTFVDPLSRNATRSWLNYTRTGDARTVSTSVITTTVLTPGDGGNPIERTEVDTTQRTPSHVLVFTQPPPAVRH
jgi:hypothetical protein